jgi:hypothetical protein
VVTAFGNYASVRTREWNYQTPWVKDNWEAMAENQRRLSPPELYDLKADPDELVNVVGAHSDVARRHHGLLMDTIERNRSITKGSLDVGEAAFKEVPLYDQSQL